MSCSSLDPYFSQAAGSYLTSYPAKWIKNLESQAVASLFPDKLQDLKVLDIGCGIGPYIDILRNKGAQRITGIDRNKNMLRRVFAHEYVNLIHGDFMETPSKIKFDLILACGVFEFFHDPLLALRNLQLWATPHAQLILLYPPLSWAARGYRFYHRQHGIQIHLFHPKQLEEHLASLNWKKQKSLRPHSFAQIESYAFCQE